ncbi:MAG: tetratricopeptide repeat protein [Flavobacteriales bacterium]|nr:tetratricopeptide repeat protein [Bacteroidota bacterium]MCB9241562.1 tetratricopeptide repeat protein [Flavobacteriales bacterium]
MKKLILLLIAPFLVMSCGRIRSESEAIEHNERGIEASNMGDSEGALQAFKEALAVGNLSKKTKATVLRNIAQTYFEMLESDSAMHYYQLAADCYDEGTFDYLVNVADIKLHQDETPEAIKMLHQAADMKPDEIQVNNTLGLIYLGEFGEEYYDAKKALIYNLKAYNTNKDRITGDVLARNYIELEKYKKAIDLYYELINNYPEMADLRYQLGTAEYYDGNTAEANRQFDETLRLDSSYSMQIQQFKLINSAALEAIQMEDKES